MPGQKTCFRCGSVLEDSQTVVEVHPPRAPAWKKPFRRFTRRMRRVRALRRVESAANGVASATFDALGLRQTPGAESPWPDVRRVTGEVIGGLIASAIPGLAHILQGRFREIRYYCAAWLVLMAGGMWFYGPGIGTTLLALAIVVHAWIAADGALLLKLVKRLAFYLMSIAALSAGVFLLYGFLNNLLLGGMDSGLAGIKVPFHEIELRDRILCRRFSYDLSRLRRGDMVLVGDVRAFGGRRLFSAARRSGEAVGQVVGLPGDLVQIKDRAFAVNGDSLDVEQYPVPHWLLAASVNEGLNEGEYFVTMEYTGGGAVRQLVRRVCVMRRDRLRARGFMLWLPVRRRHVLEDVESNEPLREP